MNEDNARIAGSPTRPSIRWWPAVITIVLAAAGFTALSFVPFPSRQHFTGAAIKLGLATGAALFGWAILLSRFPSRVRILVLVGAIGIAILGPALFRVVGRTGDGIPIIEPRWARKLVEKPQSSGITNVIASVPGAADYPQFLGPNRNGVVAEPKLATDWKAKPPTKVWRRPVGAGWSGFSVSSSFAVTQEQRGDDELVICYELSTGRVLWSHSDQTRFHESRAGEGPRATPTISSNRVLAQGATGILNCLDLATGRLLWSKNIFKEHGGKVPLWGFSSSPLVLNERVIVNAGGPKHSVVAYDIGEGKLVWNGGSQPAGYSSPVYAELAGVRQILMFSDDLVGHSAESGQVLWEFPWRGTAKVAGPLVIGTNLVFISSGYGVGSSLIKVERMTATNWTAKEVWHSIRMKAKFTNPILYRGHIYGLDDGVMACIDVATGAQKWKDGRYGHGQMILVGTVLLVTAENGGVVLIDAKPDKLRELSRFQAFDHKMWNPPALAGEYLLIRTDKEAACYRLPVLR